VKRKGPGLGGGGKEPARGKRGIGSLIRGDRNSRGEGGKGTGPSVGPWKKIMTAHMKPQKGRPKSRVREGKGRTLPGGKGGRASYISSQGGEKPGKKGKRKKNQSASGRKGKGGDLTLFDN